MIVEYHIFTSDYKVEWQKLKERRFAEGEKEKEKLEKEILSSSGIGETVPLVTSISDGKSIGDVYLKHPGNESSDDSEGEEMPVDKDEVGE